MSTLPKPKRYEHMVTLRCVQRLKEAFQKRPFPTRSWIWNRANNSDPQSTLSAISMPSKVQLSFRFGTNPRRNVARPAAFVQIDALREIFLLVAIKKRVVHRYHKV
jgi:hypothetical protein